MWFGWRGAAKPGATRSFPLRIAGRNSCPRARPGRSVSRGVRRAVRRRLGTSVPGRGGDCAVAVVGERATAPGAHRLRKRLVDAAVVPIGRAVRALLRRRNYLSRCSPHADSPFARMSPIPRGSRNREIPAWTPHPIAQPPNREGHALHAAPGRVQRSLSGAYSTVRTPATVQPPQDTARRSTGRGRALPDRGGRRPWY